MTADQFMWALARIAGLSSYGALSIALVTGVALRSNVLHWLGNNKAVKSLHEYTVFLWIPLGIVHVTSLLLDRTARIGALDVIIPFRVSYGTLAVGLGTVAVDVLFVVTITGWYKKNLSPGLWQWLHRLSYVAFALIFMHAALGGSDFSDPAVSAISWAVAASLAVLVAARVLWGRLAAER